MKNVLTAVLLFALASTASASTRVQLLAGTWTQLTTSQTFAMQSLCNYVVFIQPSAAAPLPTDPGTNAFQVGKRAIWNQSIVTTDPWWALTPSECAVIVEDI